ncbi:MAG: YihY/virulence factor BrkB family protein [Bacteriovoracaceae bacterium]|nr:YihY/virulence factor BrkB family protein [Bacteriovoracaceae bacterium]
MATATWNQRGREADSPKQIPLKGWKDTLVRVKHGIKDNRISMVSAAMAYYALFSFIPALTSVVLVYAWVSDPSEIAQHLASVSQFMPEELQEILKTQLSTLASSASTSLGIGAIFSLLLSLWAASKISKTVMEAMNIIYDEKDSRGFFKLNGMALALTLLGVLLSIVAIGVIVGIPAVTNLFNFPPLVETAATVGSWLVLLFIFSLFLAVIYRFGPNRNQAKWRWVSWGAFIASVLWAVTSLLFSWYAKEFGNFNKTYGSLAAVIVLMTWFYLSSFVILLGGEINAELEHQTKKDSTKGPAKPMGKRDAVMADTLGRSY